MYPTRMLGYYAETKYFPLSPSSWRRFRYPSRMALPWYSSWQRCVWWHIGVNIKRFTACSSLQRSSKHHIFTSQALFQWAKTNCKETEIFFTRKESYAIATEILKGRFDQAVTIPATLRYHAFISTQDRKLLTIKFSSSEKYDIFPKSQQKKP